MERHYLSRKELCRLDRSSKLFSLYFLKVLSVFVLPGLDSIIFYMQVHIPIA